MKNLKLVKKVLKNLKNNLINKMLTIEQKQRKELLELYKIVRTKYTDTEIADAYGCRKQNISNKKDGVISNLKNDIGTPKVMKKLKQALDSLNNKEE